MSLLDSFHADDLQPYLDKPLAVAVSGGADSFALVLSLWEFLNKSSSPPPIHALIVDHRLRENSTEEATLVKQRLDDLGISAHILSWNHHLVLSKIQETARLHRYRLLIEYCQQNNIPSLWLGHHASDQFETVMMRLSHSTGLRGLGGMQKVSMRDDITLCRPFLTVTPEKLFTFLIARNQQWIEDPSNLDTKYERVRWRSRSKEKPRKLER